MKEFDEIENLFSSAFEGAEMTPPPRVKESVDTALFSRAKGGFFWVYSILFIALISGVLVAYQSVVIQKGSNNNSLSYAEFNQVERAQDQNKTRVNEKTNKIIEEEKLKSVLAEDLKKSETQVIVSPNAGEVSENQERVLFNNENQLKRTERSVLSKKIKQQKNKTNLKSNATIEDNESSVGDALEDLAIISGSNADTKPIDMNEQVEPKGSLTNFYDRNVQPQDKGEISELLLSPLSKFELYPIALRDAIQTEKSVVKIEYKTPNRWSLLTYVGLQGGYNALSSNDASSQLSIKEREGFDLALEANYSFSRRFGAGVGVDYVSRQTEMNRSFVISDSTISGGNWVIDNPSQPDSLQDSTYYETYDVTISNQEVSSLTRQASYGIPVYLTYTIPLSTRFSFRLSAGGHFSYQTFKVQFEDAGLPEASYSKFGVNAMLRPELIYGFNRFGLGVYGKMTYDINHGVNWNEIKRQRYGFGGGIVLRYKF